MEEAHQPWGVLPHCRPGDLGSVGLVLRGRRAENPVATAVDEFCRGPPVALIPLGVRARWHHRVGDRASDIPATQSATRLACVAVEGWWRTETFAPPRRDQESG